MSEDCPLGTRLCDCHAAEGTTCPFCRGVCAKILNWKVYTDGTQVPVTVACLSCKKVMDVGFEEEEK